MLARRDKDSQSLECRRLQEKASFLEKELSSKKVELEASREGSNSKVMEQLNELQGLRSSLRVAEERLKLAEGEKSRLEIKHQEFAKHSGDQAREKELSLSKQVNELKSKLKSTEDELLKDKM